MKYIQNLLNVSAIIVFSCFLTFGQTEEELRDILKAKG
jgi:hypothetical protein